LFEGVPDANLGNIVAQQPRLKSSFIYLANAVNDLRGNLGVLALVLAPLVLISALCLLPDAINLQSIVARHFGAGIHSVSLTPVQVPYTTAAPAEPLPVPRWLVMVLQIASIVVTLVVNLVVLSTLDRIQSGARAPSIVGEALAVYRRSIELLPAFFWITLLQVLAIAVGVVLLVIPGLLVFIWVYFAQYALVLDSRRSWPALLYSRDLMRGRFFKVALRIVVFLAVWSGYNAWAGGIFIIISRVLGPVAVLTGTVGTIVFMLDLLAVAIAYATVAFFLAAGARLYQDLVAFSDQQAAAAREMAPLKTAALPQQAEA
jgi:hypothetical protein